MVPARTSSSTSATRGACGRFHKWADDNDEIADPLTARDYTARRPANLPDPLDEEGASCTRVGVVTLVTFHADLVRRAA